MYLKDVIKFSSQHRTLYCYLILSIWIFLLIAGETHLFPFTLLDFYMIYIVFFLQACTSTLDSPTRQIILLQQMVSTRQMQL